MLSLHFTSVFRIMNKSLFFLIAIICLASSCKTNKRLASAKEYTSTIKQSSVRYSEIHLPFKVSKSLLSDLMNQALDTLLKSDDVKMVDGVDLELSRYDDAIIELAEKDILASIPIKLEVSKNILVTQVRAEGVVTLMTSTAFDIDPFWNITTKTELVSYDWTVPMKMKSGFGGISVESIANKIIESSKETLCTQIDEALSKQLKVQEQINNIANTIRRPIQIGDLYDGFIQISPDTIQLAGFQNNIDSVQNVLSINVNSKLHASKPSSQSFVGLPRFEWTETEEKSSSLALPIEITYLQLENLVKDFLVGQIFEADGRSITIKNLKLDNDGQYIAAEADVIGSFNGTLYMTGRPEYDKEKRQLFASDVDVQVKTKNVLQKAAAWIGKGIIKKKLEEALVFSFDDQISSLQEMIDENLSTMEGNSGIALLANLKSIDIDEFLLLDDYIQATLLIEGDLGASITNLPKNLQFKD